MRVHLIKNNEVINTIAIESLELAEQLFPDNICIEATEGGPGWKYENGAVVAPPEPPRDIKSEITALEATITDRRRDEAILGIDNGWLANVRDQIAALRSQL